MIELKKPRLDGLTCNVCYSNKDILEITFRGNDSVGGTTVALCADCRNELVGMMLMEQRTSVDRMPKVFGGYEGGGRTWND